MILLLISLFCSAKELPGEEIWVAPPALEVKLSDPQVATPISTPAPSLSTEPAKTIEITTSQEIPKNKRKVKKSNGQKAVIVYGNIPPEYFVASSRQSTASELVQPPKGSSELFRGIKVGDILEVSVPHSVIAFPDEKSPVIGAADSGQLSGFKFVGESYLEKNSKRIFINFTRLVIGQQVFDLKGVGVTSEGQPGLTGEYHSREAEYFTGDFIASFAAGYFDGLVPRRTNAFGQIETDQSVDSAVKKGLSSGALSTAERFKEKLKRVPEFSEIKGPFSLKILVLEQAKTTN
ncbi:MAG: hypothetical protein ACLGGX_07135 [Bdellovibrionia bacterium]